MSEYTCANCSKVSEERVYVSNPLATDGYSSADLCYDCAVRLWPCNVRFIWNYGVPEEVRKHMETPAMLKRLRNWEVPHKFVPVHFFHRRETERTRWLMAWDHKSQYGKPDQPYGYRAWCSHNEIIVLVDETETPESIEWIFYHELGHAVCNNTHMFDYAMAEENRTEGRTYYEWKNDEGHEQDSEERLVNRIATAWMGGKERARPWWRPRVIARDRGYTVLPDAFALENSPELELFRFAVAEGWTAKRKDGSMLPIHGYDYSMCFPVLDPKDFPEDVRKSPEFRQKLEQALNPVNPLTGDVREEVHPPKQQNEAKPSNPI